MKKDVRQKLKHGSYYHIYNRGNNKENLFKEPRNYIHFLSLWKKYLDPVVKTYCYNLLPNHFHFLIRVNEISADSPTTDVSRAFSNMFNAYAKAINKAYDRTGSLFQERFRRKKITSDGDLAGMVGYILTNPVKHNICNNIHEYPWSAYHHLVSDEPTNLLRDEVIGWFRTKELFMTYIQLYELNVSENKPHRS